MHQVRTRTLAGATLALALAACGGGGGTLNGAVPVTPPSAPAGTLAGSADARFVFTIPAAVKGSSNARSPRYISASTQSIGVTATPAGGGAAVSATINVGSSNCTTTTAAQTCTLVVSAPIGSDVFVVKMYDAQNGTGNVLSTGTMTQTVQAHVANTFPLILGGTIASLAIAIDKPYQPVVDGGSAVATVIAKDAGGNQIVGGFSTPITVALPAGVTLTSGATTINDSSASQLTVRYDGASKTALALTATSGSVTGTGSIVPVSHVKYYAAPPVQPHASTFMIVKGPDGALYFGDAGVASLNGNLVAGTTPGAIARLDPATGNVTEVAISGINPIGLMFVGNDLYIGEQASSSVGRIANAGNGGFSATNYSHVVLHKATAGVFPSPSNHLDAPRALTYAGGRVFVALLYGSEVASFDPTAWAGAQTTVSYVAMNTPNGQTNLRPNGITTGRDGNVYIANSGLQKYGYVSKLVPGATAVAADVADTVPGFNTQANYPEPPGLRFIAAGADGALYLTWTSYNAVPNAPGLTRYDGASTFTLLPLPGQLYTQPDSIKSGSGSTVVFNDLGLQAVGVYDTASGTFHDYPMNGFAPGANAQYPNDVVDYGDESYWFTNQVPNIGTSPAPQVGHLVLAQGWTVFPEASTALHIDGLGGTNGIMLGIGESASSHDTFTVTSTTPAVCSVAQPPNFANDYAVTGVAAGACSISFTDQNHRTVTVPIAVTANTVTISGTRRMHQ